MDSDLEFRSIGLFTPPDGLDLSVRMETSGNGPRLTGYAAVYNSASAPMMGGKLREYVMPGAFKSTLDAKTDVRSLVDHDDYKLLARTSNGSLKLTDDSFGLRYDIALPDTSYSRDLQELVRLGTVGGVSFGFKLNSPTGQNLRFEGPMAIRELRSVQLMEISITSVPCYPATSAELRHNPDLVTAVEDFQKSLQIDMTKRRMQLTYHQTKV